MGHDLFTRRRIATGLGAAMLSPAAFSAAAQMGSLDLRHDSPSRLARATPEDYVPPSDLKIVADIYRRMSVAVRIDATGPYGFVVDTGANQSVIASDLAERLGLRRGPEAPLNGVAGVQVAPTTNARVEIGKRVLPAQTLSILPRSGIGGDGMLGLDSIGEAALTIDFVKRNLRIDAGRDNWRDPDAIAIKATRRDGQLTLVKVLLGGRPITAFIDSGAESTIGNMALRQMALTLTPQSSWTQTTIVSSTGQTITAEMADLLNLRVGNLVVPAWPVAFADLHTFAMWNMVSEPAILIGVDILSRFDSVCLDFARDEVRFRMAPTTA
ncbi:MAG TPA: retroviral-like aspartic protease family protein [Caulobacteraceae bacterium]|jgi:predicted aspartyl protease|nr:retroviral-like aspartic protease family protein [Caulobacteraceae bacterium]